MKTDIDWMDEATCRSADMSLFFSFDYDLIEQAKLLCADCPVKEDCLEIAIHRDEHGVWGGTTTDERKALRKLLNIKIEPRRAHEPFVELPEDDEWQPDKTQIIVCPTHGEMWDPTGAWHDGRHEYVVLTCGCLVIDGEFIDGLDVGVV